MASDRFEFASQNKLSLARIVQGREGGGGGGDNSKITRVEVGKGNLIKKKSQNLEAVYKF